MKLKQIALTGIALSVIAAGIFPTVVSAQTPSVKSERKAERCNRVTTRINDLLTRLQNDDNIRQNRHQKVIDRLNVIISKATAANINADKLKTDVATLTDKRGVWKSDYGALLAKLTATRQFACGESQGQFAQAVKDARLARQTMRAANMDFWNFVANTVRPDIQALRSQLKAASK